MYKIILLSQTNIVASDAPRIMVTGNNVNTVQSMSKYCLKHNFEVFPYYGIPLVEEITLFTPHALLLCLPLSNDFQSEILQPYILWLEQPLEEKLLLISSLTQLDVYLKKILSNQINFLETA